VIDCVAKPKLQHYVNEALNHYSTNDYFITSNSDTLVDFEVIDPNITFSDHLPILATIACKASTRDSCYITKTCSKTTQLRWDHADLVSYYNYTDHHLRTVAMEVDEVVNMWNANCSTIDNISSIDKLYNDVVNILVSGANLFVTAHRKNFYKFWWDEDLTLLKQESIDGKQQASLDTTLFLINDKPVGLNIDKEFVKAKILGLLPILMTCTTRSCVNRVLISGTVGILNLITQVIHANKLMVLLIVI